MRLRGPGGASTITLSDDATIQDLTSQITEKTSISSFDIKYGYPPKPLLLEESDSSMPLSKLDVKLDGEQLTISVREVAEPANRQIEAAAQNSTLPSSSFSFADGAVESSPKKQSKPIALKKKDMVDEVPEIPMAERGATLGKTQNTLYS
jgi:ubiquitin thioesterase OTU1